MKKLLMSLSCGIGISMLLLMAAPTVSLAVDTQDHPMRLNCLMYEFDKKSEYEIDSANPSDNTYLSLRLGTITINDNIQKGYDKNGIAAYEIADGKTFTLSFQYIHSLRDADKNNWHLIKDGKKVVNGSLLDDSIDYGAILFQTSFDGITWVDCQSDLNVSGNITYGSEQINDIQLSNGCYYRVIVAYEVEQRTRENPVLDDYSTKKLAQVYEFYASYKETNTAPIGEKFYFYAGAKNSVYTAKTKQNNYSGSEIIDIKDPHYGWDLGSFCLSGYTKKGDAEDVYLKKVGNKVKLTFRLDQDVNKLNGSSDLVIASDKDGSDESFKVPKHNMKRGELIIRHTDSENNTREVNYTNFLAALAFPGADTSIQLFEEGDYEVHLNYAITDKSGWDNTTYYQTSFKFRIRNSNCMVYIFDVKTGTELGNGDVTKNGFRIDSAKSSYPNLHVKREILNNTQSGLVEDTRFNSAVSDGEEFTDEGIYTIKASNKYDEKLEPAVKTIYIGNNPLLSAYIKHMDAPEHYTIAQLNQMADSGYTFTEQGDIIAPVIETTTAFSAHVDTKSSTSEVSDAMTTTESSDTENADDETYSAQEGDTTKSALPIVGGGIGIAAISSIIAVLLKKKKRKGGTL